ncbi:hypothetical protein [Streptomyces sp. RFCAC02]|uniref:hypothetical protein n=1 Tax=Streptomyces sp. RFCAC02 TaxID=2499143 RepID=UPI001F0E7A89|nr:hypothetical protein [Streptomyces sp. RFCAC02]
MPRRVSLPAADELFRTTGGAGVQSSTPQESGGAAQERGTAARLPAPAAEQPAGPGTDGDDGAAGTSPGAGTSGPAQGTGDDARGRRPGQERASGGAAVPGQPKREAAGGKAAPARSTAASSSRRGRAARRPSGRERHDEKITVYVSAEELMDLEHARLVLRGEHGLAVDRGRIVREAVAVVLADLESRGDASILVRRLRGR